MYKIVFVCHGNICRSTMAEFVMKDLVRKAKREAEFLIESRATHRDALGSDTYPGTKDELRLNNIPFTKRQATLLQPSDYPKYDLILAMDEENLRHIGRICGEDREEKVKLLLSYAGENRAIADPWYTDNFAKTYDDVLKGCQAVLKTLS